MMPSIKKLDHRLIISTPLLIRIVTLFLYTKNIIVDRQTQQVLIRFRYLWFITSAESDPHFKKFKGSIIPVKAPWIIRPDTGIVTPVILRVSVLKMTCSM